MPNSPRSGKYTVDRFEGKLAVLLFRENESEELVVPSTLLPGDIEVGSILQLELVDGDIRSVENLKEETARVRKQNEELLQELVKKNHSL